MFSGNTSQVSADQLYVEDVFSTWLYTGNAGSQTITNGIDLAGKGGMVWIKRRDGANDHILQNTSRGANNYLVSNSTVAETNASTINFSFASNGFSQNNAINALNQSGFTYASWTFREAPKFFDVVTWTGNDLVRNITHNLGVAPGCIIIKRTDTSGYNWFVYHRSRGASFFTNLNLTSAESFSGWMEYTEPTSTVFTVSGGAGVNASGGTYVAYLFAHDATSDGVIQCGSFTLSGSPATVNLGWEPQWVMIKSTTSADSWWMYDNMRGMAMTDSAYLRPDLSFGEGNWGVSAITPTATGFTIPSGVVHSSGTYIYIAIRRGPMKTPTLGTSVYTPIASSAASGTVSTTGFPVDLQIATARNSTVSRLALDRLRGVSTNSTGSGRVVYTDLTNAESSVASVSLSWDNTGFQNPVYLGGVNSIYWNFRRAPSFFDEVCYTGTGVAATISHNLGVVPELIIVKSRNQAYNWPVYSAAIGNTNRLFVNATDASSAWSPTTAGWNATSPTASAFSLGTNVQTNGSGATFVAYLFASCPGVSKVGSYTGNGSSQTINCGFAAGARFVMIKRTDSTGDWYVWDTARGIVAGNDPHLSLNTTAAEVTTDDTIDTDSSGFVVNQVAATNVNVSSATYIYLAIA